MVNIVVFGIGESYRNREHFFKENSSRIHIVGFIDNNQAVQGKVLNGVKVYAPDDIFQIHFDSIVILSNRHKKEMSRQVLDLGIEQNLIWDEKKLIQNVLRGKRTLYNGKKCNCYTKKEKILIVTTNMGFDGGTMVAVYAAQALQNRGYEVMLTAPIIKENLLEEILQEGLSITIVECLPYFFEEDREWVCYYDIVLVNVFQMMNCAYQISKIRPVLWWIHENRSIWNSIYQDTQREFNEINSREWMNRLQVVGVSNVAKEAFNHFYPSISDRIMPFGIPDKYIKNDNNELCNRKIIFAVVAGFAMYKGQEILVRAIKKLSKQENQMIEVWFIGFEETVRPWLGLEESEGDNFRFFGVLLHKEVIKIFPQIDVLVCPSLIETMSMSTIEGLMYGKLCITTDQTGIAKYITDGINGFVVKANDPDDLKNRIEWIIQNKDKWDPIKRNARNTYEQEFTLELFGERLEFELKRCKEKFYEDIVNVPSTISQSKGK